MQFCKGGSFFASPRHCEERSDEAIQSKFAYLRLPRRLLAPRNDEFKY